MLEKDKIYSLRLSDSSEIICKIVSSDSEKTVISNPFSLLPTQNGVQLIPPMISAELRPELCRYRKKCNHKYKQYNIDL